MNSTVYIYVNSIACYGPRYICKCKRHDNVRYECITNGMFGTLATERICSAVLLNCTKARIEPLFELNRTAASVASSNNGMPTFSTPSTQKKIPAECWRAKKVLKTNLTTRPNQPPPPPPQKSNGRPLIASISCLITRTGNQDLIILTELSNMNFFGMLGPVGGATYGICFAFQ